MAVMAGSFHLTSRMDEAFRLLEILLLTSEEYGVYEPTKSGSHNNESEVLYQKAYKTMTEYHERNRVDPSEPILKESKRLYLTPPLVIITRPGSMSQIDDENVISSIRISHNYPSKSQFDCHHDQMSFPFLPDNFGDSRKSKKLRLNLKLSNFSSLINALEQTVTGQYENNSEESSSLDPSIYESDVKHSAFNQLSSFCRQKRKAIRYCCKTTHKNPSNHKTKNLGNQLLSVKTQSQGHWNSLLAASLLCTQLWKLVDQQRHKHSIPTSSSETSFCKPFDSPISDDEQNLIECENWTAQLDGLTWRLEFLIQKICQCMEQRKNHQSEFNQKSTNHLQNVCPKEESDASSTASSEEDYSEDCIYCEKTKSTNGKVELPMLNIARGDDTVVKPHSRVSDDSVNNPDMTRIIGSVLSDDGEVRNTTDDKEITNVQDNILNERTNESQLYLSTIRMPRILPIWNDTLEAEVNKIRYKELTQVQKALQDLCELQENVAIKIVEAQERMDRTEVALECTEAETRGANVELATANKARSSWWRLKASGVGTIGGALAGGLILGPVGAMAAGGLAGAAGLFAGNKLRASHVAKMNRVITDNKQKRCRRNEQLETIEASVLEIPVSVETKHQARQEFYFYQPAIQTVKNSNEENRIFQYRCPTRMPFL